MKTYVATPADRERNWLLIDASGQTLGRLATQIADALRGKRKPTYTPHVDTGDFVIVVNASKIVMTAGKADKTVLYRHTGYPGGIRTQTYGELLAKKPQEAVRRAVRGLAKASSGEPLPEVWMFEVWTPLQRFDVIEDISAFADRKRRAVQCYASQLSNMQFDTAALALNRYRGALHNHGGGEFAEAFLEPKLP